MWQVGKCTGSGTGPRRAVSLPLALHCVKPSLTLRYVNGVKRDLERNADTCVCLANESIRVLRDEHVKAEALVSWTQNIQSNLDCSVMSWTQTIQSNMDCSVMSWTQTIQSNMDRSVMSWIQTIQSNMDCSVSPSVNRHRHEPCKAFTLTLRTARFKVKKR